MILLWNSHKHPLTYNDVYSGLTSMCKVLEGERTGEVTWLPTAYG